MVGVALGATHWLTGYQRWIQALADAGCPPPDAHGGTFHVGSAATCQALRGLYPAALQPAFVSRYNFTILVFQDGLPATLAIIGALIGAPLVAREIEQRTQLVSWTQSVSRRRWYVMKVTVLAAALGVVGLVVGVVAQQLQSALGAGGLDQLTVDLVLLDGSRPRGRDRARVRARCSPRCFASANAACCGSGLGKLPRSPVRVRMGGAQPHPSQVHDRSVVRRSRWWLDHPNQPGSQRPLPSGWRVLASATRLPRGAARARMVCPHDRVVRDQNPRCVVGA